MKKPPSKPPLIDLHPSHKTEGRAQSMVEFALVIPVVLLLILGIIEAGHLIFIYSSVVAASREAARYGAGVGGSGITPYKDCPGIRAAAKRIGGIAGIQDTDILIHYDAGPGTSDKYADCSSSVNIDLGDRIIVDVSVAYHPIVPLVPIPAFPIRSKNAHTILKQVPVFVGTPTAEAAGPAPTDTATEILAPTATATPTQTPAATQTPDLSPTVVSTLPPLPTPTITSTPTSTPTITPTPTATPLPICSLYVSLVGPTTTDNITWYYYFTNNGLNARMTDLSIVWDGSGVKLSSVSFGLWSTTVSASQKSPFLATPNVDLIDMMVLQVTLSKASSAPVISPIWQNIPGSCTTP